jgi:cytoskeletal protein CcmA (bactofilin family)
MAGQPAGIIGKGTVVKGSLTGAGDVIVEGRVEGQVSLEDALLVEAGGQCLADVEAAAVTVGGEVVGNVVAGERVRLASGGRLLGDIQAPSVVLEDGARFTGTIEMEVKLPEGI